MTKTYEDGLREATQEAYRAGFRDGFAEGRKVRVKVKATKPFTIEADDAPVPYIPQVYIPTMWPATSAPNTAPWVPNWSPPSGPNCTGGVYCATPDPNLQTYG